MLHLAATLALVLPAAGPQETDALVLTPEQRELALEFSPLPDPPPDPTNAVYENEDAARFGQALFFDTRLSGPGNVSCATCHDPAQSFSDGRPRAMAVKLGPKHTMSLWNVAYGRWFFWNGRKDSLWSQALTPLEDFREHASSRLQIAHVIADDAKYRDAYATLFGALPALDDTARFPAEGRPVYRQPEHPHSQAWATMTAADQNAVDDVFANVGKSIAAYERNIVSRHAPFDVFVEGLRENDAEKQRALSPSAQRGFALFAGKGKCLVCHDGPNFSDGEFHSNRAPTEENADPGRPFGVRELMRDPFNTRGRHADDGGEVGRQKLEIVGRPVHLPGEFKTPTLRNVARTAPYMREGQIATLEDVVEFYSSLDGALPLHRSSEQILQPLHLTDEEQADLLAFLRSLTDESLPARFLGPPASD